MKSSRTNLDSMWDKIDLRSKEDIKKEGEQWGLQYVERLIDDLVELKIKSKREHDPMMYHQLNSSLTRAHDVKSELLEKIKKSK